MSIDYPKAKEYIRSPMNDKVNTPLAEFGVKLLAVLERIADALEGKVIAKHAPSQTIATNDSISRAPPVAQAVSAPASDAAAVPSIPYDTVRKAILAYQDAKGAHAASEVLKQFGAKYIMDLKASPNRYAEVLEALK